MKRFLRSRFLALIVLLVMVTQTLQCGFIIYPERRTRGPTPVKPGKIDPVILVLDILWFLVGIIPGVVALIVDITTGCLYQSGSSMNIHPGARMAFRVKGRAPANAQVEVVLEQPDGKKVVTSLFEQDVLMGEEIKNDLTFAVPANVDPGKYKLALKVNGMTCAFWNLNVAP